LRAFAAAFSRSSLSRASSVTSSSSAPALCLTLTPWSRPEPSTYSKRSRRRSRVPP
jgi:hypothetical protein